MRFCKRGNQRTFARRHIDEPAVFSFSFGENNKAAFSSHAIKSSAHTAGRRPTCLIPLNYLDGFTSLDDLTQLSQDARVTMRRAGTPDLDGDCVVYWMQRAQRGIDNPALDIAVDAANALRKAVVVFFAPVPFYPNANLRHFHFLVQGIPDIAAALARRNIGFVLRRFPDHNLPQFCDEVKAALVVGDENPLREPEAWRLAAAKRLKVPLWTVDADVIVPSKLLEKPSMRPTFSVAVYSLI